MRNDILRVPKVCGADIELGNFVLERGRVTTSGFEASRALLAEIDGVPESAAHAYVYTPAVRHDGQEECRGTATGGIGSQDWGRKFLPSNGGCAYIDLDHLELCIPEVTNAWDHVAAWHAMLRIARQGLTAANERRSPGRQIQALVNNSDGQGNSYGSHLNFLMSRRAWDALFQRKFHQLQFLASFQVSSIVYTGQGKVGAENGAPEVTYQLSQRADFFETLLGLQTTFNRPIVNSRDEALCGRARWLTQSSLARLHVIFFDNTLAHGSCLLKVGVMQLIVAMLEAGHTNPTLALDDPVEAVVQISHDPTLETRVALASGKEVTAVELQYLFLEEAKKFAAAGGFQDIVPRAAEILALWEDTLARLEARDWPGLAGRLDWVLKLMAIERAMERRPELDWTSSGVKVLDHLYASLGPDGLYWAYEESGVAERQVSAGHVENLTSEPPADTRAWTRAMLLRRAESREVDSVDWDAITFRLTGRTYWPIYRTIDLRNPLRFTREETEPLLAEADSLDSLVDAFGAEDVRTTVN